MELKKNQRGFGQLEHEEYLSGKTTPLVTESSAIGDYEHSWDVPGSSYLWIGEHHLNKEQVSDLVGYLNGWLQTRKLSTPPSGGMGELCYCGCEGPNGEVYHTCLSTPEGRAAAARKREVIKTKFTLPRDFKRGEEIDVHIHMKTP